MAKLAILFDFYFQRRPKPQIFVLSSNRCESATEPASVSSRSFLRNSTTSTSTTCRSECSKQPMYGSGIVQRTSTGIHVQKQKQKPKRLTGLLRRQKSSTPKLLVLKDWKELPTKYAQQFGIRFSRNSRTAVMKMSVLSQKWRKDSKIWNTNSRSISSKHAKLVKRALMTSRRTLLITVFFIKLWATETA